MNTNRCFAVILLLFMVLTVMPVTASAAAKASGNCGVDVQWSLDAGVLKISGTGAMANYKNSTYGAAPWYAYRNEITEVVISDGVTNIGAYAFYNCVKLTKVTIGKDVESIGNSAFSACLELKQLTLPNKLKQIDGLAFAVSGLTGIRIPASVEMINTTAFMNCDNFKSITVDSKNTVYSSDSKGILFNRNKTTLILCPAGFTGSYTIPAGVNVVGEGAFQNCNGLTGVTFPSGVTTIEKFAFGICDELASVVLAEGLVTIGQEAFYGCEKLVTLKLPGSVSRIENSAFAWCRGLKDIWFQDDAPAIGQYIFSLVTAKAHYPSNYSTWTKEVRQSYGGNITWVSYEAPVVKHSYDNGKITTAPTCTASGVKTFTCKDCGKTKTETIKALGHDYSGTPVFDLDSRTHSWDCSRCDQTKTENCTLVGTVLKEATPDTYGEKEYTCSTCSGSFRAQYLYRIAGSNRWETALKVAGEMKQNLGVEKFDAIIIASGNDFADALAGSYLSTVKNAPILLAWGKGGKYEYLDTDNIDYIKANLAEGGTVYILGGTNAVPELYETSLSGFTVKRLGGANRFETNLLILEEAGVAEGSEVLVCTSTNFADSLSASATGKPILLVFNESGKLYGAQPEFLAGLTGCKFTVIGGENAVGAALAEAIGAYGEVTRLAGANRFETSVLVAQKYFEVPEYAVLAYAWNYPDGLCGGALAYTLQAPLILTMTKYEAQAAEYVQTQQIEKGIVLGGETLISDDAIRTIFAMAAPEAAK